MISNGCTRSYICFLTYFWQFPCFNHQLTSIIKGKGKKEKDGIRDRKIEEELITEFPNATAAICQLLILYSTAPTVNTVYIYGVYMCWCNDGPPFPVSISILATA